MTTITGDHVQAPRASKWIWLGLFVLAVVAAVAAWMAYSLATYKEAELRTAEITLRHETLDQTVDSPQLEFRPALSPRVDDLSPLEPGESLTTRVQFYPTGWWANSYNSTVIHLSELPEGWTIDRVQCTDSVVADPYLMWGFSLTYDAKQVGEGEISASCTIWTRAPN